MKEPTMQLINNLNHEQIKVRLASLTELVRQINSGELPVSKSTGSVNNHIHTTYSFSPYSPTKAVWMAYNAGLTTAGIMDHDSISGAEEFTAAGKIISLATTIGIECRADFSQTPLNGRLINNPDQKSIAYLALHGIPHSQIGKVTDFFTPYRQERNIRNQKMVARLNDLFAPHNIHLSFDQDVKPLSMAQAGGSITERHILFALAHKLITTYGRGRVLVDFLKNTLKLEFGKKLEDYLLDSDNRYYPYDLLGVLKGDLVKAFYIPATAECPDIRDVIRLSQEIGSISAYAYLGDVGDSVTGDKKSQKFEDDYLDLLFAVLQDLGFNAITYMPSRNTLTQLLRLKSLCQQHGFFEISGEDINSPRQSFICDALLQKEFTNLIDSTWALIGHERVATKDISQGMFQPQAIAKYPELGDRIAYFKEIGRKQQ